MVAEYNRNTKVTKTLISGIAALSVLVTAPGAYAGKGIKRECQIKLDVEQTKLTNVEEIKTCIKGLWPTIPNPNKGQWVVNYPPPAEYDRPFAGILMIQRLSMDEITKICLKHRTGCALVVNTDRGVYINHIVGNRTACIVIITNDADLHKQHALFKDAVRHETTHCNGWPQNHPGMERQIRMGGEMKKALLSGIAALFLATGTAQSALGAEPKTWNEACREYVFNERAWSWEKNPNPNDANQKPWLSYCEGYLEGLFDAALLTGFICLPDGGYWPRIQITGNVAAAFERETDPKMRGAPPVLALQALRKEFPCKVKDKK
jgi:hypothetical protein